MNPKILFLKNRVTSLKAHVKIKEINESCRSSSRSQVLKFKQYFAMFLLALEIPKYSRNNMREIWNTWEER